MDYHKWILDDSQILNNLEADLKGLYFDSNHGQWLKKSQPLMNDEGIASIRSIMSSILSKNTLLSVINGEDDFEAQAWGTFTSTYSTIVLNRKNWGITINNLTLISTIILNYIIFAYKRAINSGERDFAKSTIISQRKVNETQKIYPVADSGGMSENEIA